MSKIANAFVEFISPIVTSGNISDKAVEILDETLMKIQKQPKLYDVFIGEAIAKLRPLPRAEAIIDKLQSFHPFGAPGAKRPAPFTPSSHIPIYDGLSVGPHNKPKEDKPVVPLPFPTPGPGHNKTPVPPADQRDWTDTAKTWLPWLGGLAGLAAAYAASGPVGVAAHAGYNYLLPAIISLGTHVADERPGLNKPTRDIYYPLEDLPNFNVKDIYNEAYKHQNGLAPDASDGLLSAATDVAKQLTSYLTTRYPGATQQLVSSAVQALLKDYVPGTGTTFKPGDSVVNNNNPAKTPTSQILDVVDALIPDNTYPQYAFDIARQAYPTIQDWAFNQVHLAKPASFAVNQLTGALQGNWPQSVGDAIPETSGLSAIFGEGPSGAALRRKKKRIAVQGNFVQVLQNAPVQLPSPREAAIESLNVFKTQVVESLKKHPFNKATVTEAVKVFNQASTVPFNKSKIDAIANYILKPNDAKVLEKTLNALKNVHADIASEEPLSVEGQMSRDKHLTKAALTMRQPQALPTPHANLEDTKQALLPGDEKGLSDEVGLRLPPLTVWDSKVPLYVDPRQNYPERGTFVEPGYPLTLGLDPHYNESLNEYLRPLPTPWSSTNEPGIDRQMELIRGIHRTF